jgi:hypothetical protein
VTAVMDLAVAVSVVFLAAVCVLAVGLAVYLKLSAPHRARRH